MKKKIILFGAALAALATFTSCSSEGDPILDTPVEPIEPVVKGTPFKVRIGDGTTRADFSKTTTANLATFQLYGIQQTATPNYWMDGLKFTKSGTDWNAEEYKNDAWTATAPSWPVDNKDVVTNFYGFSDGETNGTPAGVTPSITPTAQSFTFTFGNGIDVSRYYSQYTQTQIDNATVPAQATAWQNQRNAKQSSAKIIESNRQLDLLVTQDNTTGVEGTDGTLSLSFKHALANLVIKAMFVGDAAGTKWPSTTVFYIEWIRIHGLYTSGTYTFGTGWSCDTNDSKIVYEKNFGEADSAPTDPRWQMTVVPSATYAEADEAGKKATYQTIVDVGEFMAIPQDYSSRAYTSSGETGSATPITTAQSNNQCYIELCGYFKTTPTTAATGQGQILYLPLNVKNNNIIAGKQHTILLDLTAVLKSDGVYLATPSQAGGN